MRNETKVVLSALEGREKYDDACKRTWMLREIIAPVLRYTIKEYQTHTVSDVIRYINADSISDKVPVDDLPAFIKGDETELSSPTEKRVFFDVHFTAKNPDLSSKDVLVMLHIDFEVQNEYKPSNPGYPITKRAVYYAARELSSQLKAVTDTTNYDELEKVYSIWICNEKIPEGLKNSITRYHMEKEDIVGKCEESEAYHDLLEAVIVRRGGEALENTLFEYLEGVFTTDFDTINKYVDVEDNEEVKEVLNTMCGLGESLEIKGFEKGIKQGIKQGSINTLISLIKKGRLTKEEAAQEINMDVEAFEKIMLEGVR